MQKNIQKHNENNNVEAETGHEAERSDNAEEETMLQDDSVDHFNAKITKQTATSVAIDWNLIQHADVYKVEKYKKSASGWIKVAWSSQGPVTVDDLDENFAYRIRIHALQYRADLKEYVTLQSSPDFVAFTLAAPPTTVCLHRAIRMGQQFLVKRLLRRRRSLVEYPAPNGYLPLANAITCCEISIIDSLLTAGASVHVGNPRNLRTPLHLAFYHGRLLAARMLFYRRADLEGRDIIGMTACHFAVDANQLEMLRFALENGANVEASDAMGWTLLMRAVVMRSDLAILQLLVLHRSNLRALDSLGQSCVELARFYGNTEAASYFNKLLSKQERKKLERLGKL